MVYERRMESRLVAGKLAQRSARIASIFSFLIVGVGHWYIGAWRRALAWELGLFAVVWIAVLLNIPEYFFGTIGLTFASLSAWDAWKVALKGGATKGWDWQAIPFALLVVTLVAAVLFVLFYLGCSLGGDCL